MSECIFCNLRHEIIYENTHVFAVYDRFPVSKGHVLIIPKRHIEHYFEASEEEVRDIHKALHALKAHLDKRHAPDGYNIGVNVHAAAGQTVFHLHIHLIPRYAGDVDDPTGGVRGVIPDKKTY